MRQKGFTLVELVVVMGIIGVLICLLLPAVNAARESGRRIQCQNNLRQIGLALHMHHQRENQFPAGVTGSTGKYSHMSWLTRILPFLEQNDLWLNADRDYARTRNPFSMPTHTGLSHVVTQFSCPSEGDAGRVHFARSQFIVALTDYVGVAGTDFRAKNGVLMRDSATRMGDIRDGTSQTICVGERPPSADAWYGWWYAGVGQEESGVPDMLLGVNELNVGYDVFGNCPTVSHYEPPEPGSACSTLHYWSAHPDGSHFVYCDGSVRRLSFSVENPVLLALSTKNGADEANDVH